MAPCSHTRQTSPAEDVSLTLRSADAGIRRLNDLRRHGRLPIVLRGRRFTYRGLHRIILSVAAHYSEGRTQISRVVCRRLNWRQPNGWLKDRACRDVLVQLERLGLFVLPPPRDGYTSKRQSAKQAARAFALPPGTDKAVTTMPRTLEFVWAKGNANELLWNALVEQHHYLGYGVQVGRCLKYLIEGDGQLLGAIGFSSPAWDIALRSELMFRLQFDKAQVRDVVINNSRFLLLPGVRVPHLASRALAAALKHAVADWSWYYAIRPVLAGNVRRAE